MFTGLMLEYCVILAFGLNFLLNVVSPNDNEECVGHRWVVLVRKACSLGAAAAQAAKSRLWLPFSFSVKSLIWLHIAEGI